MELQRLKDRLYRIERRERTLRIGLLALAVSAGLAVACGMMPGRPPIVETETLLLTDSAGRVRGLFSAGNDEPVLVLTDSKGVKRLRFRIEDKGPTISLYDADQNLRLQMSGGGELPEVTLFDDHDTPKVRLRGSQDEPQVVLFDAQGRSRARFFVLDGEQSLGSGLSLVNQEGVQQVLMTALPDGTGVIRAGSETLAPSLKPKAAARPAMLPK